MMRRISRANYRRVAQALACASFFVFAGLGGADWDPSAIRITPPNDIPWKDNGQSATAILAGDPSKPGIYVELTKWHAGHMSRPHYHPNDRYIYVISGTWWVGTGTKYDPDSTKPMPPGSYVLHTAKGVHYDGAKDADCVIEIVGMGPATSTPAEVK